MTDQHLVLQVSDHLGLSGQGPGQPASIRSRGLHRRPQSDRDLMHVGRRLIDTLDQQFDEPVGHLFIFVLIRHLESVVEEDVRLVLVVVLVTHLEVLLGDLHGRLVLVNPQHRFQHLHHLVTGLVPHGGAGQDAGDVVRGFHATRLRRVRVDADGLVVLSAVRVVWVDDASVRVEALRFVVLSSVHREGLVDQQRVVHGRHEQGLGGGQTLAVRRPDVQRDPRL